MKKYNAINKRNGRKFVVTMMEDKAITFDTEKKKEKEVSFATIKRWFELGEEIKEKKEKKKLHVPQSQRNDKFRPKLNEEQVIEIREKFNQGKRKSHLAREYGVSFRTITCIVEYIMWKKVK